MTSPLAAKATFNRHAACEMGKKQKQFFCRSVTSSVLQYLPPCPAPTPFFSWVTLGMHHGLLPHHSQPSSPSGAPGPGLSHSPASNAHLAFRNPAREVCLALLGGTLGMEGDLAHPSSSPGLQQKGTPVTPQSTTSRVHVPHATVSDRLTLRHLVQLVVRFEKL